MSFAAPVPQAAHETMPEMDAAIDDELRALRERAYGPDADIADDPDAVRRLRELEGLRLGEETAHVSAVRDDDRASLQDASDLRDGSGPSLRGDEDENDPAAMDQDAEPPAGSPRIRRRLIVLWAGSVLAAAAVASAVTWSVASIPPITAASGAPQIDTIEPSLTSDFSPGDFGAAEDSPVWEYHGLTMFRAPNGGPDDSLSGDCLWLYIMDDEAADGSRGGWGYTGCSAGSFPATVTLALRDDLPEELLARFPGARALQFVLDGDRLGVFLDSGG